MSDSKKFFELVHVHLKTGPHGGGNGHGQHIGTFGSLRLGLIDGLEQSTQIAQDLFGAERNFAEIVCR